MKDIRQDITVLPADDPKKLRLGWTIEERTTHMVPSESNECYEFEEADKYIGAGGAKVENLNACGYSVVPCLQFLYGQPWNNLALNYTMSLNPNVIRVIEYGKGMHCDCCRGRVTVYLEKDDRTIKKVEQESETGMIGCDNGYDLRLKLQQQVAGKKIKQFDACSCFVNKSALDKIDIVVE